MSHTETRKPERVGTIKLPCICPNPYQDLRYGPGIRLHNLQNLKNRGSRCTVCGRHNDEPR